MHTFNFTVNHREKERNYCNSHSDAREPVQCRAQVHVALPKLLVFLIQHPERFSMRGLHFFTLEKLSFQQHSRHFFFLHGSVSCELLVGVRFSDELNHELCSLQNVRKCRVS